ncbi:MAG TPA: alpha/beta hydrolase [Terriglobia bacterium]|nr:alpha/beta hydrolase [Terriglobia bacterium]
MLNFDDVRKLPVSPGAQRIPYGPRAVEFGDLRLPGGLPKGHGRCPVAIVIHGGCWSSEYNLDHIASFADALTQAGVATWNLEYRRIGDADGGWPRLYRGWPGTFEDVARGADYVRVLGPKYALDLDRVVAVGHSAGGQLALWLAARTKLPKASPLYSSEPDKSIRLRGVVSLAGIPDLRRAFRENVCDDTARQLLGGSPAEVPERYHDASPIELLPLGVPQRLVHGTEDSTVPLAFSHDYAMAARRSGDDARLIVVPHAGHFELIVPGSLAWPVVEAAVREMLGRGAVQ